MDAATSPVTLVTFLIWLVVVVAVVWVAIWVIDQTLPEPVRMVAKVVVGLIALLFLVYRFLPGL